MGGRLLARLVNDRLSPLGCASGDTMTPEISEFSYGFALTNELVGWTAVAAAPVFPSLIQEGLSGYDVKLEFPAAALYLQFKRSGCMRRKSAREIKHFDLSIDVPYYRFCITESNKSDQHELLLSLEQTGNNVFYAAPRFHTLSEINWAWQENAVASSSIFVAPQTIGALDEETHSVAFDANDVWLCSDPKKITALTSGELLEKVTAGLRADDRPLRSKIPEMAERLQTAQRVAGERIQARRRAAEEARRRSLSRDPGIRFQRILDEPSRRETAPSPPRPEVRQPRPLEEPLQTLRDTADKAARLFDCQLVLIQPPEARG